MTTERDTTPLYFGNHVPDEVEDSALGRIGLEEIGTESDFFPSTPNEWESYLKPDSGFRQSRIPSGINVTEGRSVFQFLGEWSFHIPAPMRNAAAAICLDLLSSSFQDRKSAPVFVSDYFLDVLKANLVTVSVSPGLRMPREQVKASSFNPPSGALLTWLEMLEEETDE
jgi:hypothetical protein